MPPIVFTPDYVMKRLQSLSPQKAAGSDKLHPKILRALAPFIAESLTELSNLSLLTTEVPEHWRSAIICPIFKKGDREVTGNYRPVSLTSIVCKVMKSAMKETIMSHLLWTAVLADAQHGFVPRRVVLRIFFSQSNG